MIKLSYIKSSNRRYNVERCLSLIKSEITRGLRDAKKIVIVPDCIVTDNQLATTHVETLNSLLAFIEPHVRCQIILAARSSIGNTFDAFKNYGYYQLQEIYDLAIIDLDIEDSLMVPIADTNGREYSVGVSQPLLDSDYIISVCPPKTHNQILYTGALNNIISSSIQRTNRRRRAFFGLKNNPDDRKIVYETRDAAYETIRTLDRKLKINLSIIDGFEVMEGDGPIDGKLVPGHFCIAGIDPNNVDILACKCLGLDLAEVKYLESTSRWSDYFVIGDDWQKNIMKLQLPNLLHST